MLAIALTIIHASGISARAARRDHPAARALGPRGQQGLATYQSLSQTLPFIERTQDAEQRYVESAPPEGDVPLQVVQTIAFATSPTPTGPTGRCCPTSASRSRAAKWSGSSVRPARASRR